MRDEQIDLSRFKKSELLNTLETLFLGHYISPLNDIIDCHRREEISMNYLALKDLIKKSGAS